jgi:hypothetical protein
MSPPRAASAAHAGVAARRTGASCAAALLVAVLAGCGVKAPPRPPLPEKAEARAPVAAAPEEDCGCAAPLLPLLATTTTTATQANP